MDEGYPVAASQAEEAAGSNGNPAVSAGHSAGRTSWSFSKDAPTFQLPAVYHSGGRFAHARRHSNNVVIGMLNVSVGSGNKNETIWCESIDSGHDLVVQSAQHWSDRME